MKIFTHAFFSYSLIALGFISCQKQSRSMESVEQVESNIAQVAREQQKELKEKAWVSSHILEKLSSKDTAVDSFLNGTAHFGILYFKDRPAHRVVLLNWIKENGGEVEFENEQFGYFDVSLSWASIQKLIDSAGQVGLSDSSIFKLEIDEVVLNDQKSQPVDKREKGALDQPENLNTSLFGPVHSAGYGSKVTEFREQIAKDLNIPVENIEGQGTTVAVADQGIDLSRTDIFGSRLKDFQIGDEANWRSTEKTEENIYTTTLNESDYFVDLNGNEVLDDRLPVRITESDGTFWAQIETSPGAGFGDKVADFSHASAQSLPTTLDLYSGKFYEREFPQPSPSAVGFKFKKNAKGELKIAFVGLRNGSEHGIANLHMVGGDMLDPSSQVRYFGVAPKTNFIGMQIWNVNNAAGEYGSKWIPLARSMILAAAAKSDVIDLDIYTPGTRDSNDLLDQLACRISNTTNSVIVVAAHNFGPLPDTIQSLAQSPCVLGIGASHSLAALRYGRNQPSIDPGFAGKPDDTVQIAHYSGRGFGMNGWMKPDIISPAYAYTAYGEHMTRFGGTSGATPATAGMIALLKQAARFSGTELNFHQVRFLFQNSSIRPGNEAIRDGYGFSNLWAAWELFKDKNTSNSFKVTPLFISHKKRLHWDGRPSTQQFSIPLTRSAVIGDSGEPLSMKFWIEYAEDAAFSPHKWLKFRSPHTGQLEEQIQLDVPFTGESTNLAMVFDIPDYMWPHMPKGRVTALIKGVRTSLDDGSSVEFVKPVTIFNGQEVNETQFYAKPLYADQVQVYTFNAKPGDVFWVSSQNACVGQNIPAIGTNRSIDSIMFVADNTLTPSHASMVMNGYEPLVLGPTPLKIKAEKDQIHFGIARRRQANCIGGVQAEIFVRRVGIETKVEKFTWNEPQTPFELSLQMKLTSGTLNETEIVRNTMWNPRLEKPQLVLTFPIDQNARLKTSENMNSLRLIVAKPQFFQGALGLFDATGVALQVLTSKDLTSDTSGFGSLSQEVGQRWVGLGVSSESLSQTFEVRFESLSSKSQSSVSIRFDLPESSARLMANPIAQWNINQFVKVGVKASIPAKIKEEIAALLEANPTTHVRWESQLKMVEYQLSETPTAGTPSLEVWNDKVSWDLPMMSLK